MGGARCPVRCLALSSNRLIWGDADMVRLIVAAFAMLLAVPAMAQPAGEAGWSPALERKCAANDAVACWQLGEAFTLGRGTVANPAKAAAAFGKACDGAIGEACFIAAGARSDAGDQPGAFALYQKGCAAASGDACLYAAIRTETGRGATRDFKAAMVIYDRACTLREQRSCLYMAKLWASGENPYGRVDGAAALKYSGLGCEWGDGEACGLASHLAGGNLGAPRDQAAATRYATMGCNAGHFGGCMNMGYYASQRKEWTEAKRWYARACQLSDQQGSCKAKRDIDTYLADVARQRDERARWDAAQARGAADITRMLGSGDYAGAIQKATYDMGSEEQVSRVLTAAQDAGKLSEIDDIYFVTFEGRWKLTPRATSIVSTEGRARIVAQRRRSQASFVPNFGGSGGSGWQPSSSSVPAQTYAAIPRISESEIYRNAQQNTRNSYCNAGWGCR